LVKELTFEPEKTVGRYKCE